MRKEQLPGLAGLSARRQSSAGPCRTRAMLPTVEATPAALQEENQKLQRDNDKLRRQLDMSRVV